MAAGHIILDTRVDTTGVTKGFAAIKSGANSVMGAVGKLGAALGIAFGVKALIDFAKSSIELSSDVQEVQNVVDVAFGDMRDQMEAFADTAIETFGISKLTAKQTGSTYMAMAKGMGIAGQEAADMALNLTGLSADMASFYNVSQKYTDIALKSVFTGETETLKQYGIVMTQTNLQEFARQKGITKSIQSMTQQEQTLLRYQYVMKQTALAQGDFARTQDSWANQTRILSERWKEMKIVWGDAFRTIGTLVLPAVNNLIKGLSTVANYAKIAAQSIARLFGKEIDSSEETANNIGEAVDNQDDLTQATKETTKAAKDQLAAFDELNQISQDTADTATSGTGGLATGGAGTAGVAVDYTIKPTVDTSDIESKFSKLKTVLAPLTSAFDNLWNSLRRVSSVEFKFLKSLWNDTLKPMGLWLANTVLADILNSISNGLKKAQPALEKLNNVLGRIGQHTFESLQWIWEKVGKPANDWAMETLLPTVLELIAAALDALDSVIEALKPTVEWLWDNFLEPLRDFVWDLIIGFLNLLVDAFNGLADWAKENPDAIQIIADIILAFLAGLWIYNTSKKIISFIGELSGAFKKFKATLSSLATPTNAMILAIAILAAGIIYLWQNWDKLTPAQRTITILGALAAALIAAAVAVALFHTSWTVGVGAAAIAAGIALLAGTYLFKKANQQGSTTHLASSGAAHGGGSGSISKYAKYANMANPIPKLAKGAVLPANKPFLAQLGDQKNGRNLEAPESLLREVYSEQQQPVVELLQELIEVEKQGRTLVANDRELARTVNNANSQMGTAIVKGGYQFGY